MSIFNTIFNNYLTAQKSFAMLNERKNLKVNWRLINGCQCLYFQFKDVFTEQDALDGIEIWKNMFNDLVTDKKHIIVWDCREMKGYESKARLLWQKAIKTLKNKIDIIYLITGSVAIQLGADMVSYFTSMKIRTVTSKENLEKLLTSA